MKKITLVERFLRTLMCVFVLASAGFSQTTEFTYQGKLSTLGLPAIINHDMSFRLFDAATGGEQIGETLTRSNVHPSAGVYTVQLDFGAEPFSGDDRWIEVSASPAGLNIYATLPRQKLTSAPYAIQAARAVSAETATNAIQLDGVTLGQVVQTNDSRLSDDRIPLPGSGNYIQNTTAPQNASNFNVTGVGTAGIINAATQFNIGGSRVLSAMGNANTFVGINSGRSNAGGQLNSFFGNSAGNANTTGSSNSFFGAGAGFRNTIGHGNSFFGVSAGDANTTGGSNSFFGTQTGAGNSTGSANSFFGAQAGFSNTTGNGNSFFGREAGFLSNTGVNNSFFGDRAGAANTTGNFNSFYGEQAGANNTTGADNTFVGRAAGIANTTGSRNSFFGKDTGITNATGSNNSFFGHAAGQKITGHSNSFFGQGAGMVATTGNSNSFFGHDTGKEITTGSENVFIGNFAGGDFVTFSSGNTFIGYNANVLPHFAGGQGGNNTIVGSNAKALSWVNNSTAIGANAYVGNSNTIVLGTSVETVVVPGGLNVQGTKNFRIDHPLDPENKYLYHAAIESSEVLNIYSGNVTTDKKGYAVVTLPEWFEAINRDFRYQLTVIGAFAQAIVANEVRGNRFAIKTNIPNTKVSWQVTEFGRTHFFSNGLLR